ncbi:MAG: hypothetical protein GY847_07085 [Proteobacteria bacterium]|nr:hypothetical protein [Pseudomonadota bacterium]
MCGASSARADYFGAPPPTRGIVGGKIGFVSATNFKAAKQMKTEPGFSGGLFFDFPVTSRFYAGLSVDFHNIVLVRDQQVMIDLALTLKPLFPLKNSKMILVPAVSVGYAYLSELNVFEPTEYLNLKFFLETHFETNRKRAWVGDLGISYMPTGGNGDYDIQIGPTFFIRWGLAFR